MSLRELSRYDVLLSQFQVGDLAIAQTKQQSLDRLFHYIYEHTDLLYLSFMRKEILINYLQYHALDQFQTLSFNEVMKDIKFFIRFLKNNKEINCHIDLDLSLLHEDLWKSILKTN
ncbi:hypothetical protein MUB24_04355 [Lederbergia sp. NSJ-179]|uniref:hypothetical protein n=1 Tax=Lederbergia sp. NSJ-179 TaxID=2931402 RepID=UPI001FD0DE79|nr:hypothetical protein [Lederbergia sp. NSJ-179]MCJ7840154.1 hypothetical protein [Lederbergia sp. NSJ-179]